MPHDIAIIGISCRFPGANNLSEYWDLLLHSRSAITEVPASRWDVNRFYDPDPGVPGKANTKWGGFLKQPGACDNTFFNLSPEEAIHIDPQQRLILELGWEALEDAGIAPDCLKGSRAGVYIGVSHNDYERIIYRDYRRITQYHGTGSYQSVVASRLSYFLNLTGPSISVDTACSSVLSAVHVACMALRQENLPLALVGGVTLHLTPDETIGLTKGGMLSGVGLCKSFDSGADGYVRGEGGGILVLKRLEDATRDRDRIYGVVKGSAVNHNGRSNGLSAPSGLALRAVMEEGLAAAEVDPAEVSFLEAHGTGTRIGDQIEMRALREVYDKASKNKLWLGCVKTNIGHLETASGMASIIKVLLSMQHGTIPANLHFTGNSVPADPAKSRMHIPTVAAPWTTESGPRIAAVTAYGFGGANGHVVIEEPRDTLEMSERVEEMQILCLSARNETALREMLAAYDTALANDQVELADVCYTANTGRACFDWRIAFVGEDKTSMRRQIAAALQAGAVGNNIRKRSIVSGSKSACADFGGKGAGKVQETKTLYEQGGKIDWQKLYEPLKYRKVPLPTYPFQRKEFWFDADLEGRIEPVLSSKPSSAVETPIPPPGSRAVEMIDWLQDYARTRLDSRLIDERRCIPPHVVSDFSNAGLMGLIVPKAYGGSALTLRDCLKVFEQAGAVDITLASFLGVHNVLGMVPIMEGATEELRQNHLPLLALGQKLGAFAITEAGAGSNPRAMVASARPDSSGRLRITGEKIWIGSGSWAGVLSVFVNEYGSAGELMGVSGFAVAGNAPGLRHGPEALTMGVRGMVQNTVILDGLLAADAQRLGKPGKGMDIAQAAFHLGRLGIGAMAVGAMKRCLQLVERYAHRRSISTGVLADNPIYLRFLADTVARIEAVQYFVYLVAVLRDNGVVVPDEVYAVAKIASTEHLWLIVDGTMQFTGGRGYIETNAIPQFFRDARLLRIFEGPSETLQTFIGSVHLKGHRALTTFLRDHCSGRVSDQLWEVFMHLDARMEPTLQVLRLDTMAAYRMGEVLCNGVLWASAEKAGCEASVLEWWAERFDQSVKSLKTYIARIPRIDGVSLHMNSARLAAEVGAVDQASAQMDELLRNQPHVAQVVQMDARKLPVVERQYGMADQHGEWLLNLIARKIKVAPDDLDLDRPFNEFGIDSFIAVEIAHEIEDKLGREVDPTVLWNYPTLNALLGYLLVMDSKAPERQDLVDALRKELEEV